MKFNSQQMVSYCLDLRTQNLGLRQVDLEVSPKRGSDKLNKLEQGKKNPKENKLHCTAWTVMKTSCFKKWLKMAISLPSPEEILIEIMTTMPNATINSSCWKIQ